MCVGWAQPQAVPDVNKAKAGALLTHRASRGDRRRSQPGGARRQVVLSDGRRQSTWWGADWRRPRGQDSDGPVTSGAGEGGGPAEGTAKAPGRGRAAGKERPG